MAISKEHLIVPAYLNEKIVLDMLAIIEDGFSMVSEVSSLSENTDKISGNVNGGFSTQNILSKLLKIQLDVGIENENKEKNSENIKREKVHTNVSLLSKLRIALQNNGLLSCEAGAPINIEEYNTGDFIEIEGELEKNPMIDLIEKFLKVYKMAEIFDEKAPVGNRKKATEIKSSEKKTLQQMEQFLNELKSTGTIDFIVENTEATLVLSAQEKYMENDNISELLGGKFRVLGKVIKICRAEGETIDLLRKTTLDVLDEKTKEEILGAFNNDDLKGFNLPELRTQIEAPALIIIPIAIYA